MGTLPTHALDDWLHHVDELLATIERQDERAGQTSLPPGLEPEDAA
jgi:hypothetical protein